MQNVLMKEVAVLKMRLEIQSTCISFAINVKTAAKNLQRFSEFFFSDHVLPQEAKSYCQCFLNKGIVIIVLPG